MSVSAICGTRLMTVPNRYAVLPSGTASIGGVSKPGLRLGSGLMIECSSRPQKKATAHHMKTRPRKTQPWDIKRKPTVYPPLPPLPPDWTLVSSTSEKDDATAQETQTPPSTEEEPSV